MDKFFQQNRDSYIKQVSSFTPPQSHDVRTSDESGDTVIATRVRPLLAHEIADKEVVGISVRPESDIYIHELRRKINGELTLNVRAFLLF